MDSKDAFSCLKIMERLSVSLKWQKGDIVLVDNVLALHARKTFFPPRRILAALFGENS